VGGDEEVQENLSAKHKELIESWGLPSNIIDDRKYETVSLEDSLNYGFKEGYPSDPKGAGAGLLSRLTRPDGSDGGVILELDEPRMGRGDPPQFIQCELPYKQMNVLHVPLPVIELVGVREQPLFITNSPRKADFLASLGLPAVGLNGERGYKGRNPRHRIEWISDWDLLPIENREFIIVFDSDAHGYTARKYASWNARLLGDQLLNRNAAKVLACLLPDIMGNGKTGIDDFIRHLRKQGSTDQEIRNNLKSLYLPYDDQELEFIEDLPTRTIQEILASNPAEPDWIVEGWIASNAVTELDGKVKHGKTTLSLAGIKAIVQGKEFLGMRTQKTSVLYLYEGRDATLVDETYRLGLQDIQGLQIVSLQNLRRKEWTETCSMIRKYCKLHEIGLVWVDTLSKWSGVEDENGIKDSTYSMEPLELLAEQGLAVVANRQSGKKGGEPSNAGRGHSSVAGTSDIILTLEKVNYHKNRRLIKGSGRFTAIPEELIYEFNKATGEYTLLGDYADIQTQKYRNLIMDNETCRTVKEFTAKFNLANDEGFARVTFDRAVDYLVAKGAVQKVEKFSGNQIGIIPLPMGASPMGSSNKGDE